MLDATSGKRALYIAFQKSANYVDPFVHDRSRNAGKRPDTWLFFADVQPRLIEPCRSSHQIGGLEEVSGKRALLVEPSQALMRGVAGYTAL